MFEAQKMWAINDEAILEAKMIWYLQFAFCKIMFGIFQGLAPQNPTRNLQG